MERFYAEWQERLEQWWMATPHRELASRCLSALGLHISARLEMLLRSRHGQSNREGPSASASASEDGCELLEQAPEMLNLPDFPDLPSNFALPPVLPIPQLLPKQQWLQLPNLQSSVGGRAPLGAQLNSRWHLAAMGVGSAAGSTLALAAVLWMGARRKQPDTARYPPRPNGNAC